MLQYQQHGVNTTAQKLPKYFRLTFEKGVLIWYIKYDKSEIVKHTMKLKAGKKKRERERTRWQRFPRLKG